ncbi:hypothetical protein D0864_08098 [Hortaea werneckii]|uniref:ABM domain-containing protein n=1 Tax=Hortaea werneckii TaxID=91943 RepID=A0A3M7F030_HORWE|nr:hypothetical protein D0864_08098 [Hortaea werneckii]
MAVDIRRYRTFTLPRRRKQHCKNLPRDADIGISFHRCDCATQSREAGKSKTLMTSRTLFISEAIEWIRNNEPDTLEFSLYECASEDGVQLSMVEKYTSQAAMDRHEASGHYQEFFKSMTDENLIAGPPTMSKGTFVSSLRR